MAEFKCKYCGAPIAACEKPELVVCGGIRRHEQQAVAEGRCGNLALYPGLRDPKFIKLYNKAVYLRQNMKFEEAAETLDFMISSKINDLAVYFERALCNYGVVYSLDESLDAEHIICRRINEVPFAADPYYNLALHRSKGEVRRYVESMAQTIDIHQKQMQTCAEVTEPKEIAICYSTVESGDIKKFVSDARRKLAERSFSIMLPTDDSIETEIAHLFRAADTAKTMIIVTDRPESLSTTENYDCIKRFMARAAVDKSLKMAVICNNYDSANVPTAFYDFLLVDTHFTTSAELFDQIKQVLFRLFYRDGGLYEEIPAKFEDIFAFINAGYFRVARMYIKDFVKSHDGRYQYYLARLLLEYKAKNVEALAVSDSLITTGKYYNLALAVADEEGKAQLARCAEDNLLHCKLLYSKLCSEYKKYTTYTELMDAAEKFKLLGELENSADLALECKMLALSYPNISISGDYFVKYEPNRSGDECFEVPETITCIRHDAFNGATNLKKVILHEGITAIEPRAFFGCTSLTDIVLPRGLIKISHAAFSGCSALKSIRFPESLQKIGYSAFRGCSSIESIVLPRGLARIGNGAFAGCTSLSSVTAWFIGESRARNNYAGYIFGAERYVQNGTSMPVSLTNFCLKGLHTEIPESAFYNCIHLQNIEIPKTVTHIAKNAFFDCRSLKALPLTPVLESLGNFAFANCKKITEAHMPDSLKYIGDHALRGCELLESVTFPSGLVSAGRNCLDECDRLTSLTLPFVGRSDSEDNFLGHLFGSENPDGNKHSVPDSLSRVTITQRLKLLPPRAFEGCRALRSVILPCDLTEIGRSAFEGCRHLESADLPSTLLAIGDRAFEGCRHLPSVKLPDSIISIGERAFGGCRSVDTLVIPDGIEKIGAGAFAEMSALTSLTLPFVGGSRTENTFIGYIFGADATSQNGSYVPASLKEITVTPNCERLYAAAFFGCSFVERFSIPTAITELPPSCFKGCSSMRALPMTSVITSVCDSCFADCRSVEELVIHEALSTIEDYAFSGCSAIRALEFPGTLTKIGFGAFAGCSSLETVSLMYVGGSRNENNYLGYIFGSSSKKDSSAAIPASLKRVSLDEAWDVIGDYSFAGASSVESVKLSSRTKSIGKLAFKGCASIERIELPSALIKLGDGAFEDCTSMTSLTIPDSVEKIGGGALSGCSALSSLTLPFVGLNRKSDRQLRFLFDRERASDLQAPPLPEGLKSVRLTEACTEIADRAFEDCSPITRFELPSTVTYVGDSAFKGCTRITAIEFEDGLTKIGSSALAGCTSLLSVTLPNSLKKIGSELLMGSSSVKSVTVPFIGTKADSCSFLSYLFGGTSAADNKKLVPPTLSSLRITGRVTELAESAFAGAVKIEVISLPDEIKAIPDHSFEGCHGLTSVTISKDVERIGDFSFADCRSLVGIELPGLRNIGQSAFKNCRSIGKLALPKELLTVGAKAFSGCKNLSISFEGTAELWQSLDSNRESGLTKKNTVSCGW